MIFLSIILLLWDWWILSGTFSTYLKNHPFIEETHFIVHTDLLSRRIVSLSPQTDKFHFKYWIRIDVPDIACGNTYSNIHLAFAEELFINFAGKGILVLLCFIFLCTKRQRQTVVNWLRLGWDGDDINTKATPLFHCREHEFSSLVG